MSVGRDGHQGWSRASEEAWERVFRRSERGAELLRMSPNVLRLYCDPGEIVEAGGRRWRVTPYHRLEEID